MMMHVEDGTVGRLDGSSLSPSVTEPSIDIDHLLSAVVGSNYWQAITSKQFIVVNK